MLEAVTVVPAVVLVAAVVTFTDIPAELAGVCIVDVVLPSLPVVAVDVLGTVTGVLPSAADVVGTVPGVFPLLLNILLQFLPTGLLCFELHSVQWYLAMKIFLPTTCC